MKNQSQDVHSAIVYLNTMKSWIFNKYTSVEINQDRREIKFSKRIEFSLTATEADLSSSLQLTNEKLYMSPSFGIPNAGHVSSDRNK